MDETVLLATGSPVPINTSLLASVASSGKYQDLTGTLTSLTQLQNDLTSVPGAFSVPGALTVGSVLSAGPQPISLNGTLQATSLGVTAATLTAAGPFVATGSVSCSQTLGVSGSLTCGSGIKAQGVQIPKTVFGTVSGSLSIGTGSAGTLAVTYGITYSNMPAVNAAVVGSGAPLLATVEGLSKTGFNAVLWNLSSTAYTGSPTVAWQAWGTS